MFVCMDVERAYIIFAATMPVDSSRNDLPIKSFAQSNNEAVIATSNDFRF